jgi:hypothetical protein
MRIQKKNDALHLSKISIANSAQNAIDVGELTSNTNQLINAISPVSGDVNALSGQVVALNNNLNSFNNNINTLINRSNYIVQLYNNQNINFSTTSSTIVEIPINAPNATEYSKKNNTSVLITAVLSHRVSGGSGVYADFYYSISPATGSVSWVGWVEPSHRIANATEAFQASLIDNRAAGFYNFKIGIRATTATTVIIDNISFVIQEIGNV